MREDFTRESGGRWHDGAAAEMMGMSSPEWSRYMSDALQVPMEPEEISRAVVARLERGYREHAPLLPHAGEAVRWAAQRWRLGLASSSNRPLIDLVLERTGLGSFFAVTVSSEEVARGKPAPDVYLEAARRLAVDPSSSAAVEDSTNGIRSAKAAGMYVTAVPRPEYPPEEDAIGLADAVLPSLADLGSVLEQIG